MLPLLFGLAAPPAPWTFRGRQVERRSTSRTELLIEFTLRPGEDPVDAVRGCVQASKVAYPQATYLYCAAYSPASWNVLFGRLRLCSSASLQWFGPDPDDTADGAARLSLPTDDRRYPKRCPAPVQPRPTRAD